MSLERLIGELSLFTIIVLLAALGLQILYLRNLYRCLKVVQPHNRRMEPGLVFLMLIPLFNLVWGFVMVVRIAQSMRNEFAQRKGVPSEALPGRNAGIAYYVLSIVNSIPIPAFSGPLFLITVSLWILYWQKMARFRRDLLRIPIPVGGDQPIVPDTHTPAGWRPEDIEGVEGAWKPPTPLGSERQPPPFNPKD